MKPSRLRWLQELKRAAQNDARIVGVVDYGSGCLGRADEWSDADVIVFVRDEDLAAFQSEWKVWAARLGPLLLAFVGQIGNPWAVYDAQPMALRVDFAFWPASDVAKMSEWKQVPVSVEAMVIFDREGEISAQAAKLAQNSVFPADVRAIFESFCGDFWAYALRCWAQMQRGNEWAARHNLFVMTDKLAALLKLEAEDLERWETSAAVVGIEKILTPERQYQLRECSAGRGDTEFWRALRATASLGREVCEALATRNGWEWPEKVVAQVIMQKSVSIRPMQANDVDALFSAFGGSDWNKRREMFENYFTQHEAGARHTLVAEVKSEIVGYANVVWESGYAPFRKAGIPEIYDMNVLAPHQRKGIATAFIAEAERIVASCGHKTIGIGFGVTPDYGAAQRLYPKLGYVPDGRGVHTIGEDNVSYLTKTLNP